MIEPYNQLTINGYHPVVANDFLPDAVIGNHPIFTDIQDDTVPGTVYQTQTASSNPQVPALFDRVLLGARIRSTDFDPYKKPGVNLAMPRASTVTFTGPGHARTTPDGNWYRDQDGIEKVTIGLTSPLPTLGQTTPFNISISAEGGFMSYAGGDGNKIEAQLDANGAQLLQLGYQCYDISGQPFGAGAVNTFPVDSTQQTRSVPGGFAAIEFFVAPTPMGYMDPAQASITLPGGRGYLIASVSLITPLDVATPDIPGQWNVSGYARGFAFNDQAGIALFSAASDPGASGDGVVFAPVGADGTVDIDVTCTGIAIRFTPDAGATWQWAGFVPVDLEPTDKIILGTYRLMPDGDTATGDGPVLSSMPHTVMIDWNINDIGNV